jgi:hypothetical protein
VISAAAHQPGQKFAGFAGDAALAVALGRAGTRQPPTPSSPSASTTTSTCGPAKEDRAMKESPLVELLETEYRRVWDRFYDEFKFQPSTSPFKWPAIKEPVASVTWSLPALDDDPEYERLDRLVEVVE